MSLPSPLTPVVQQDPTFQPALTPPSRRRISFRMSRCLADGALPEKPVWDREGAIDAGGGRPTGMIAKSVRWSARCRHFG
jgi:hypothetical protein